jgi:HAE1 family hydrophobic/amphiphilic exporter-1
VTGGALGAPPNSADNAFQITVTAQGRFDEAKQFENVIVRATEDGRIVRVRNVARVEVGARAYVTNSYLDGSPAVALGIFQLF